MEPELAPGRSILLVMRPVVGISQCLDDRGPHETALEIIRVFGDQVIPKFDTDPVHRTTRFREAAGGPLVPRD